MYDHSALAAFATDRFALVCIALFVEAIVGRVSWLFRFLWHPYEVLRRAAGVLDRRLNRQRRGPRALIIRGAIVTTFLCLAAFGVGVALEWWAGTFPSGWVVHLALVTVLISQRGSYADASRTIRALTRDGLPAARKQAARFYKGSVNSLDDHGICRVLTEHLATGLGRWLVGPLFWYLVFGLPTLFLYAAILAAAGRLAADDSGRAGFGWMADRLQRFAGWLPGRLAGLLVVLTSFLAPTARPIRAFRRMIKSASRLPLPDHAWPTAAFAGALTIEIAGPNSTEGRALPWIGEGSARMTARDAHRALMLYGYACVLDATIIAALAVVNLWLL